MSLKDALHAEKKPRGSKFEQWIATLDDDDRKALLAAAVDPELSGQAIVRAIQAAGGSVNKDTISNWRRAHGFTR